MKKAGSIPAKKTTRILKDFRGAIQARHPPGGSTDVRLEGGPATAGWYVYVFLKTSGFFASLP